MSENSRLIGRVAAHELDIIGPLNPADTSKAKERQAVENTFHFFDALGGPSELGSVSLDASFSEVGEKLSTLLEGSLIKVDPQKDKQDLIGRTSRALNSGVRMADSVSILGCWVIDPKSKYFVDGVALAETKKGRRDFGPTLKWTKLS